MTFLLFCLILFYESCSVSRQLSRRSGFIGQNFTLKQSIRRFKMAKSEKTQLDSTTAFPPGRPRNASKGSCRFTSGFLFAYGVGIGPVIG